MEQIHNKIIYFQIERGQSAKKHIWSILNLSHFVIDMKENCELLMYQIPEFYVGKQLWEKEKLLETMQKELEQPGVIDYYLQPDLCGILDIREKLPPDMLLSKVLHQNPCWEYLFLIGYGEKEDEYGEEAVFQRDISIDEMKEFFWLAIQKYLPRINHFTVVTDKPELYEDISNYIYQEFGIPTAYTTKLQKNLGKTKKTVIVDGRHYYKPPYPMIPEEAFYIDLWSEKEKQCLIETKRRDIRYLSAVKFLDTVTKNGYNIIANQT